ncbi:hypothetical protein [Streptococcus suis]|uniref:hypothetical protein n=1 Tax=Streptococcus suis TaxID=1307 RepID=UPI001C93981C|nr:hypothetical protein [Streptococcus suis]MBY5027376.1 hypothetical protein [Streptococcus suis]
MKFEKREQLSFKTRKKEIRKQKKPEKQALSELNSNENPSEKDRLPCDESL